MEKMVLFEKIKHVCLSNKVYDFIIKPFDEIIYPVISKEELQKEREKEKIPFNKIANISDLCNKEWKGIVNELQSSFSLTEENFHRKNWEFIQILYILKQTGALFPENRGLAIGAGREVILYYLTYKIREIIGIDLYEGYFQGGEDLSDVPEHPQKYLPFPYNEKRLKLMKMDALDIDFKNESFDFVFSASSIEHFGSNRKIFKSSEEIYRVLKPGGLLIITTELKLNKLGKNIPNTKIFKLEKLINLFEKTGFRLYKKNIDIKIEKEMLDNWVKLSAEINKLPHVILRYFTTIFSSFSLVLIKPGNKVKYGTWSGFDKIEKLKYKGEIEVMLQDKENLTENSEIGFSIKLKNNSNFKWFVEGGSHRIAIGIKLLDLNNKIINDAFDELKIPKDLDIGESIVFNATIKNNLRKGKYRLFFDLKREIITWFSEKGSSPFLIDIEIV